MKPTFKEFVKQKNKEFLRFVTNLAIFFPYFFSVKRLLHTFFDPWKNLTTKKTVRGFSLNEWASRTSFNLISRGIGAGMRSSILAAYLLSQVGLVLALPFMTAIHVTLLPLRYLFSQMKKTDQQAKEEQRAEFVKRRTLSGENALRVEAWFERYFAQHLKHTSWWELDNLLGTPPLARDWSMGYTPTLDLYAQELTIPKHHFKQLVDREKEIAQIEQILTKSGENNVVIVGEEGVGKHTIVEGLAKRIWQGKTNAVLAYHRVIKIDMEKLLAQSTDRATREVLLKAVFHEAYTAGNVILMLENLDKYVAAGPDSTDLSDVIEQYAKTQELQFIGITTPHLYEKFIRPNGKINQTFEKVNVFEIGHDEALQITLDAVYDFERRFRILIPYETILETVNKSQHYITDIPFPEKAIDLLDETCVYTIEHMKQQIVIPQYTDAVLTQKTRIPVTLDEKLKDKLLNLENLLKKEIIAQDEAMSKLAAALRKSLVVDKDRKKPLATFLFFGPTGVGKTETAKVITRVFFGVESHLLRFDMSLYQSLDDIPNLIGDPKGGNPGLLSRAIRELPYGVLLIDEVEKAHPDLLNIFLTVLDEGYFTDGFGKRVDCKNLIVIATSNAASDFIFQKARDQSMPGTDEFIRYLVQQGLFSPEFLNRFDGVVVYKPLPREALTLVAKKILQSVIEEVGSTHKVTLQITPPFLDHLVDVGYSPEFGARNMERAIRDELEDKVAKILLENKVHEGGAITF